jgi:phosphatidylserine/phosphatidylglycerophosphate/cardiolipin synthase-like enzyme
MSHGWGSLAGLLVAVAAACNPPGTDPAIAPAASTGVQLIVEPDAGARAVLGLVTAARASVWMEMYLLTDADAIAALAARARAGCDVRAILEPHPYQADGANQAAYDALAVAGATVAWSSPRFALTHAKAIVIDHVRLAVMTLNLTQAGLTANREYVAIDDGRDDVAAAEALIAADLAGGGTVPAAGRLIASPGGTRAPLAALIDGASQSLDLEMEELSDSGMVDALAAAATRNVAVTIVLPASGLSAASASAAQRLAAAGVVVRQLAAPDVHAKVIAADRRRLYVGSINLTSASLDANREIGLVIDGAGPASTAAETVARDQMNGSPP